MSDIIDRLEHEQTRSGMWADTCLLSEEAASEIRKLIAERDEWREACIAHGAKAERAEAALAEAVEAEREECAKILDRREEIETEMSKRHADNGKHFKAREAAHVARIAKADAAAIRARKSGGE